jgi:beta-phosphoglucomutase-like phosphatase (HAD superfamily)
LHATLGLAAAEHFEVIFTAQEVATKKPDPAVYNGVLEHLRLTRADAFAIEDSRNGLIAAMRAGSPCTVTPTPYSAADEFAEALVRLMELDHHPEQSNRPVALNDRRYSHTSAVSI